MITFQGAGAVVLCLFAVLGFGVAVVWLGRQAWGRLQEFARCRLARRMEAGREQKAKAIWRKFLRHAPSGRVGLCVEAGVTMHRWLGWLRVVETVDLIVCPGCARRELEPMRPGVMVYSMPHLGQRIRVPLRETVAALGPEITAFRAAMEKCNPEGTDQ